MTSKDHPAMPQDPEPQLIERRRIFARSLRAARNRAQLTQADVADALGVTTEVYARYERAQIWTTVRGLRRLCMVLGCSADVLLGGTDAEASASPPPPSAPPLVRRVVRQVRRASPSALRLVSLLLRELRSQEG